MRSSRSSTPERSRGFTFVETIAALAVVALLAGIIYAVAASSGRATTSITALGRTNAQIIAIDAALREAAARVQAPYWAILKLESAEREWSLPYCDGMPSEQVRIRLQDQALTIRAGEDETTTTGVASCGVELVEGEENAPAVRLTLEFTGGRTVEITARLGSWWIYEHENPCAFCRDGRPIGHAARGGNPGGGEALQRACRDPATACR
jgi:prepilin-type N-terminal cleavage/methylation domain-containing protein